MSTRTFGRLTVHIDKKPKPDGWHTYHVCGGLLREIVWSGIDAHCVVCGWWCRVLPTPPNTNLPSSDD